MARLVFIGEKFEGRIYEFAIERTTVGRGAHNTLCVQDTSVSQTHCEIFVYNEDVIVRDLGSSNGTFVNGERLHQQQRPLKPGHIVQFGTVAARLEVAAPPSADTVTDLTAFHARDRQRPPPAPAPVNAPAPLTPGATPTPAEHTMVMSRLPETKSPPSLPERKPSFPMWMIVFLVIGLVILAVILAMSLLS